MRLFYVIVQREWRIAFRQRAEVLNPWIFFLMIISLFPLGISPEPQLLKIIAPGALWIGLLFMTLLSLDRFLRQDLDNGVIEQWQLLSENFTWIIFARMIAHWLISYLPMWLLAPLLAVWLHIPATVLPVLLLSLLLGTLALSFIGAILAALTIQLRQGGLLLALLALPLYVPILIFATMATNDALIGAPALGPLASLGAITVPALTLAPFAAAAALKIGFA